MLRLLPLFLIASPTLAAEADTHALSSGSFAQAMLALAFIVALLFGTAWLARKLSAGKGFGQGGLEIIGGVALGPRERIALVEVGDTWLVVGIVPGQIRTLHRMPKGCRPEDDLSAAGKPFASWLKAVTEKRRNA